MEPVNAIDVDEIPVDELFFDEFRTGFDEQLSNLTSAVSDSANVLPELSQPNGNGVVYARFVDIRDRLYTAESGSETETVLNEVSA